jgi:hypothetical protein
VITLNELLNLPPHADCYDRAAAVRRHPDFEALVYTAYGAGLYASPESARAVLTRLMALGAASDPRQCEPAIGGGYAVLYDGVLIGHVAAASDAAALWRAYERFLRDEGYTLPAALVGASLFETTEEASHAA